MSPGDAKLTRKGNAASPDPPWCAPLLDLDPAAVYGTTVIATSRPVTNSVTYSVPVFLSSVVEVGRSRRNDRRRIARVPKAQHQPSGVNRGPIPEAC
jgi:hypothetical protein